MASLDLHEKANFTRLSRLLVDKGTEALRNTFDGIHSPASLPAVLSANKTFLLKLKPRVINDSQWDLLYPPSGSPPDSKTFDVTLLTILFRNICGLPKTGWGVMPVDSDRSVQANLVRIRLFRNEVYVHVTSTRVDNATFESLWKKISQTLVDLNISPKDIDELKTCPLEPQEEEYKEAHEEESLIMQEGLGVISMESCINHFTIQIMDEQIVASNRSTDQFLLIKLAKPNFRGKIRSKAKSFLPGTRQWLLKEVDELMIENEHESSILLLTAGPGFGKTVFSARVCEDFKKKGKLAGCHFCDFSESSLRNPMIMLESLASQMCDNVVGFKEKLLGHLKLPHEVQNLRDAFRIYLQNPLDELELAEPFLIVIDGLDEIAADDKNEIVNLMTDYFPDLPKFIKVLVTSRPEISVAKLDGFTKISIEEEYIADNDSDLKFYLKSHLPSRSDREDSGVFEKLVKMCEGSFLYAFLLLSALQKQVDLDQLMLDERTKFLPKDLDSVYFAYFRRLEDGLKAVMPRNFDVLKLLEMLVASKGPLPITFITRALGLTSDCRETKNIMNKSIEVVSCLLYVSGDLLTVAHTSVVDWLLAKGFSDHEYTVKAIDGDRSLWIMCEEYFKEIKDAVSSGHDVNLTNNLMYTLKHGFQHLASCKIIESYAWLVDVVIVYNVLAVSEIDHNCVLECWKNVRDLNEGLTGELEERIKWHSRVLDYIVNELAAAKEDIRYFYLKFVLYSRKIFSKAERFFAESCLSKFREQLKSPDPLKSTSGKVYSSFGEDVEKKVYCPDKDSCPIVKARSLALRFADTNPCCVRAIPYENPNKAAEQKSFIMCLYVDNGNKGISDDFKQAANEMFVDYEIEYVDLQRRPIPQIVTHLPASKKVKDKELKDLSKIIEKNLHVFENRLNVTAVQASYKVVDSNEKDIPCVTVYVLGKRRIPLGETELKELDNHPFDVNLDVVEGYFQPCSNDFDYKSYAFPLLGGVGIGIDKDDYKSHVGTLGGFLEDEDGKLYVLSCKHVLNPDENDSPEIVQPAEIDFKNALKDAKKSVSAWSAKLEKQERGLKVFTDEAYCNYENNVRDTKKELKKLQKRQLKVENSKPRTIGKYFCGLKENEFVKITNDSHADVYVDAAIAELNDFEANKIKMEKYDEPDDDCSPLFGFKNDKEKGFVPTGHFVDLQEFDNPRNNDLRFMKYGRTTGLTVDGEFETTEFFLKREGFKNSVCAGNLCNIPYILYCSSCEPVTNENQVDLSCITKPSCSRCNKEITGNVTAFWAKNCMAIRKRKHPFCEEGDSGALVFDNQGRVWGMVFGVFSAEGINFDFGLATPLSVILQALGKISEKKLTLWRKKEGPDEILAAAVQTKVELLD